MGGLFVAIAVLLSSCHATPSWPLPFHDVLGTSRFGDSVLAARRSGVPNATIVWNVTLPSYRPMQAEDGEWYGLDAPVISGPTGSVFFANKVGDKNVTIVAVDIHTGALKWKAFFNGNFVYESLAVDAQGLAFALNSSIVRLSLSGGTTLWEYVLSPGQAVVSGLSISSEGYIFAVVKNTATNNAALIKLDLSGTVIMHYDGNGQLYLYDEPVFPLLLSNDQVVVFPGYNKSANKMLVLALDAVNGTLKWQNHFAVEEYMTLGTGDIIFVYTDNDQVLSVLSSNGTFLWKAYVGEVRDVRMSVDGSQIFVANRYSESYAGQMFVIDAKSGKAFANSKLYSLPSHLSVTTAGVAFAAGTQFYILNPKTLQEVYQSTAFGGLLTGLAEVSPGVLIFGEQRTGAVYSVKIY